MGKEDHCDPPPTKNLDDFYNSALAKMRDCLNATGRPIFFDLCVTSCLNQDQDGRWIDLHNASCWHEWYQNATQLGNSWRTTTDIAVLNGTLTWKSVLRNWYRNNAFQEKFELAAFSGPHQWNDP